MCERSELLGRLGGELSRCRSRSQVVGMLHNRAQDAKRLFGLVTKIDQPERMNKLRGVSEVRVDLKTVEVADHEQGRILKCFAVQKELVVRGSQVLPRPLVLPAEEAPPPHISE